MFDKPEYDLTSVCKKPEVSLDGNKLKGRWALTCQREAVWGYCNASVPKKIFRHILEAYRHQAQTLKIKSSKVL